MPHSPVLRTQSSTLAGSLSFEQNTDQVAYLSRGQGYALFLALERIELALGGPSPGTGAAGSMRWVRGNDRPAITGLEPQAMVSNYILGDAPAGWITNVPHFGRVRCESVYRGVDLEYYRHNGELEFAWHVAPGADPSQIGMTFTGADATELDAAGDQRE